MFNPQECKQFVQKLFDQSALPSLVEYIEIPNLSRTYDPQWNTNGRLVDAANHIKTWVQSIGIEGLKSEVIHDQGFSPLIFTQIKGDLPVTVFFYGHFDKQPPFEGWDEGLGATKPVIKNDKLYGRGGADDGYSTYGTMLAIKAVQQQKIKIPRCVMITEGDEESGSVHMHHYLPKLKERIGSPKIFFCLDSGALDYDRLWLSTSLRGNLVGTLKVSTMRDGVHSGDSSGVVPNCYRIAKILLNRIQNSQTGQINEAFHVDIPAEFYKQSFELTQIKGDEAVKAFPFLQNCKPVSQNTFTSILNRTWKPTLTITGQSGFPQAQGSGNVNLPSIEIRFSLRLPPTLDGQKAAQKLKQLLLSNPPYNAKVELLDVRAAEGWTSPPYQQFLSQAISQSSKLFYNQQYLCQGEGGSIPLMNTLSQTWPQGQFVITGVLGPNSNAHGPNQFLHLPYTKKLICCMAHVLAKCSENFIKQ